MSRIYLNKFCNRNVNSFVPKYGDAYNSRGDINFALGNKKLACSDYKNAIANGYKSKEKYLESDEGSWCRNMII